MEYSTGIIYHYFENKEQILDCVMREGYQRILLSISPTDPSLPPDETLCISLRGFFEEVLRNPEIYKMIMLNNSPQVLEFTSVLGDGCVEKSPGLTTLASTLDAGIEAGLFALCDKRTTAQVIWSAMFGLIIRLIIERDVTLEQRSKLIDRQIEFILKGLRP